MLAVSCSGGGGGVFCLYRGYSKKCALLTLNIINESLKKLLSFAGSGRIPKIL